MAQDDVFIESGALAEHVGRVFHAAGCDEEEAGRIGRTLVSANLAGHDSHGVIRTPRYLQMMRSGYLHPGQTLTVVSDSPSYALVDGNMGFGQTIGPQAVDLGIRKARESGAAIVALRSSGHLGRIGDWGERAAAAGLVSIHFVNVAGSVLVAPHGAAERRFGTNPVCICVPLPDGPPLLLDFATSLVAEGKVLVASNGGKPLPEGALVAPDGSPSSDPATLYGPLSPGGPRDASGGEGALRAFGGHKGGGLALMCEVLAGCLTGGGTAGPLDPSRQGWFANGMLSIYLDPGSLAGAGFSSQVREWLDWVRAARPAGEEAMLLPGEPEVRTRERRLREGVPLQAETWSRLVLAGQEFGLAAPEPVGG